MFSVRKQKFCSTHYLKVLQVFTAALTAEGIYHTHSAPQGMVLQAQVGPWEGLAEVLQV